MNFDEYLVADLLINGGDPAPVAKLLRSEVALSHEFRAFLANWLERGRANHRPRTPMLKKAKRDFFIIATYAYKLKNGTNRTVAKEFVARECGVSLAEVKRVLTADKKGIGELMPDI